MKSQKVKIGFIVSIVLCCSLVGLSVAQYLMSQQMAFSGGVGSVGNIAIVDSTTGNAFTGTNFSNFNASGTWLWQAFNVTNTGNIPVLISWNITSLTPASSPAWVASGQNTYQTTDGEFKIGVYTGMGTGAQNYQTKLCQLNATAGQKTQIYWVGFECLSIAQIETCNYGITIYANDTA